MRDLSRTASLDALASLLGSRPKNLARLVDLGDGAYRRYYSSTLERQIEEPDEELKQLQRAMLKTLAPGTRLHPAAHGGVPGRSTLTNVRGHHRAAAVAQLDVRRFFPSVTRGMVRDAFRRQGLGGEALEFLTVLTTLTRGLPTGAPSSPWVGNLVLGQLDTALTRFCRPRGVHYTRYVDDLALSGRACTEAFYEARRLIKGLGFECSPHKCRPLCPPDRPIVITGYVVNGLTLKPPRGYRDRVGRLVHDLCQRRARGERIEAAELDIVLGHLAYLRETCQSAALAHRSKLLKVGLSVERDHLPPALCGTM